MSSKGTYGVLYLELLQGVFDEYISLHKESLTGRVVEFLKKKYVPYNLERLSYVVCEHNERWLLELLDSFDDKVIDKFPKEYLYTYDGVFSVYAARRWIINVSGFMHGSRCLPEGFHMTDTDELRSIV